MTDELLFQKILAVAKKDPADSMAYRDLFDLAVASGSHEWNKQMRGLLAANLMSGRDRDTMFEVYRKSLRYDACVDFGCFMQYMEIDRQPKDRFYLPRIRILGKATGYIQQMIDGELDELFLSMPPRVGKTTLLMFLCAFIIGKDSEASNLYCAFSDTITKAFYNGVLEILNDPVTYKWHEIFPEAKVVGTNSQDETINIDRRKRYPSLTARSLYGTLNGACDCNGFEISDDLIGGIEEALNPDRLDAAWAKVDNNLIPRAKEQARLLWCGTRWSLRDPSGRRMELLENDERFANRRVKIINLPALNEKDESNFHYDYGVGFSTEYYHMRRASFEKNNDIASWNAQYMGEPIEREGALFTPDGFKYYNGELPEGEPDRVFCAVDPAFGGGDFVAAPICYQYDGLIYVHDVVYNDGDKSVTQPLLVRAVEKHGIQAMTVEANKSTESYAQDINKALREKGLRINMVTKPAPNTVAKEQKIFDKAPDIRELMVFREPSCRSKEYNLFMQNVFSFKITGKNKHDDAPDSLSMAIDMVTAAGRKIQVLRRPV